MSVREITCNDLGAYLDFRKKLWPAHASAGCWEVVITKYFQNPHRAQCPGSGLYGYFQGSRLAGMMGAYPMPVTLKDATYPGHMLVDWSALPEFRFGPVAGQLWGKLTSLPGRKFGSVGTQFSQSALQKRAKKIPAREATGLLSLSSGIAVKLLEPKLFSLASPLHLDQLETVPGVTLIEPSQVRVAAPAATAAYVRRSPDFWQAFCEARLFNGAFSVRVVSEGEADIVLRLTEIGRFRFCTLLSVHLEPYTVVHARMAGRALRNFLRRLNVGVLYATEADEQLKAVIESACRFVRRAEVYWWSIPAPADTFRHDEVSWWLTSAERDSIYGGGQPFDPR